MWNTRNKNLYEDEFVADLNAWSYAIQYVHDYQWVMEVEQGDYQQVRHGWCCLQPGIWKTNFDGAKLSDWGYGWGIVVHDSEGDVLPRQSSKGPAS